MKPNHASATAYLIAESTVLTRYSAELAEFIPLRAAELSARFTGPDSYLSRLRQNFRRSGFGRSVSFWLERRTIPGLKLHYALRKRFLEETSRAAITDGVGQVVVLGAGFDTMALRLSEEFPAIQFIEVDHPATQEQKLARLDAAVTERSISFVSLVLPEELTEHALAAAGYRRDVPSLFIAEGLLMYFTPAAVRRLFKFVRTQSAPHSRFAFTFMASRRGERIGFRNSSPLVDLWLKLYGEPFKSSLDPAELPEFAQENGFELREQADVETLRQRYLAPRGLQRLVLAAGESIAIAERV